MENGHKITITNSVNTKIVWEIDNFSYHANQTGAIGSPKFEIVGPNGDKNKLFMEIHPNGLNGRQERVTIYGYGYTSNRTQEFVALYVKPAEEKTEVPTRIELAILDSNGVEKHKTGVTRTINNNPRIMGFAPKSYLECPKFIERRILLDGYNGLLTNGKLTIVCHIDIEQVDLPAKQIPPCQLSADFANLLKGGILADFDLISSDNKEFKAHKIILACRSPVFAAMFQQDGMTEAKTNQVKIEDIRGDVLQQMLHFIYTGNAPNIGAKGKELLAAADKYQIESLKVFCERSLALSLNNGNACDLFVSADLHSANHLKSEVVQFIVSHADEVIKSDGWQILSKGCHLLAPLFEAMASRKRNL